MVHQFAFPRSFAMYWWLSPCNSSSFLALYSRQSILVVNKVVHFCSGTVQPSSSTIGLRDVWCTVANTDLLQYISKWNAVLSVELRKCYLALDGFTLDWGFKAKLLLSEAKVWSDWGQLEDFPSQFHLHSKEGHI